MAALWQAVPAAVGGWRLQVGDKIQEVSASFGPDVWEARNYGQVMYAIKTRNGQVYLKLLKRDGNLDILEARAPLRPPLSPSCLSFARFLFLAPQAALVPDTVCSVVAHPTPYDVLSALQVQNRLSAVLTTPCIPSPASACAAVGAASEELPVYSGSSVSAPLSRALREPAQALILTLEEHAELALFVASCCPVGLVYTRACTRTRVAPRSAYQNGSACADVCIAL